MGSAACGTPTARPMPKTRAKFLDQYSHRQTQTRYKGSNSWVSPGPLFEIEVDLIDLTNLASENGGYRYALVAIDNFTKFAHAVPVKGKTPDVLIKAMEEVFDKIGTPKQLYSDYEGAFENKAWLQMINGKNIKHIRTVGSAHMVERFNRTLKHMIQTRLTAQGLSRDLWVRELAPILRKYNKTPHGSTGMSPNDAVTPSNELAVSFALNERATKSRKYPQLEKGDKVRVLAKRDQKTKGYMPKWSLEKFHVTYKADDGAGYLINDEKRRVYQRHELLKVSSQSDTPEGRAAEGRKD